MPTEVERQRGVDGGYAWVIVGAAFYVHFLAAGTFMCFGAIYVELLDYFPQPRSVASLIPALTGVSCAVAGPLSSLVSTRYGHRTTVLVGSIMTVTGFFISGLAPNIYFLIVSYGVLVGAGVGLVWVTFVVAVVGYFREKRGIAQGLAFCGGGCSYLVFPFMYRVLVDNYTWRGSFWIVSGLWANGCVAGALLRPLPIQQSSGGKNAAKTVLRKWTFYLFVLSHFLFHVDMMTFVNILPDHARQSGHSAVKSGLLLTILGAPIIPVRVLGNLIIDRRLISPTLYFSFMCLLLALTALLFPFYHDYWFEATISALRGGCMGIVVPLSTVVCAEVFSPERMTAAFGLTVLADGFSGLVGPFFAGFTFDMTGTYTLAYIVYGCFSIIAALLGVIIHLYRTGRIGKRYKHKPTGMTDIILHDEPDADTQHLQPDDKASLKPSPTTRRHGYLLRPHGNHLDDDDGDRRSTGTPYQSRSSLNLAAPIEVQVLMNELNGDQDENENEGSVT